MSHLRQLRSDEPWLDEARVKINRGIRRLAAIDSTFDATLTANVGSTTFTAAGTPGVEKITATSFISWMALTVNAAAEKAGPTMYVSAQGVGTVTITHVNNAQADRTFRFFVSGGQE